MSCEYCNNKSGLTDHRGNCISCGAPVSTARLHTSGIMTKEEARERFLDMAPNPFAYLTYACDTAGTPLNDYETLTVRGAIDWDSPGGMITLRKGDDMKII